METAILFLFLVGIVAVVALLIKKKRYKNCINRSWFGALHTLPKTNECLRIIYYIYDKGWTYKSNLY